MKKIVVLLLVALSFSSCEKDDICSADTNTTPRLIIDFYDFTNSTVAKSITNLAIANDDVIDSIKFSNVSKIKVPLKISGNSTKFKFILNYNNADVALINEDILEFKYISNNIYISRACGFKTLFTLDAITPVIKTDLGPANFWIRKITVIQPNILNENETHIKIYF